MPPTPTGFPADLPKGILNPRTGGTVTPRLPEKEGFLDRAWKLDTAANLGQRLWSLAEENQPIFTHVIRVTVVGGAQADLRRTYYLALAAAFGRYRRRVRGIQSADIEAAIDVTGKIVRITISYLNKGTFGRAAAVGGLTVTELFTQGPDQVTVGGGWPGFLISISAASPIVSTAISLGMTVAGSLIPGVGLIGSTVASPLSNFIAGSLSTRRQNVKTLNSTSLPFNWKVTYPCDTSSPQPLHVFAPWTQVRLVNVLRELPRQNLPANSFSPASRIVLPWRRTINGARVREVDDGSISDGDASLPVLPDDGRVITTGEKNDPRVQNPRPPVDGVSRAGVLRLVAQALSEPCYLPKSPPCPVAGSVAGSNGLYVYPPGLKSASEQIKVTEKMTAVLDNGVSPLNVGVITLPGTGPDGYGALDDKTFNVRQ